MDAYALLIGLLAVVVGLAFTFFGYRLFLILLPIWGAVVGFFFGANLAAVLFGREFLGDATSILVGILVAVLFAIAAYLWYWLAVALLAGSIGYSIGLGVMRYIGATDRTVIIVVAVVVAILFAIAAIWLGLPKYLAILFTSIGGAFAAVTGVGVLIGRIPVSALESGSIGAHVGSDLGLVWLIASLLLAAIGVVYQIMSTSAMEPIGYGSYRNPWRRTLV
jgi:uncharacterized protein DUF4203